MHHNIQLHIVLLILSHLSFSFSLSLSYLSPVLSYFLQSSSKLAPIAYALSSSVTGWLELARTRMLVSVSENNMCYA